MRITPAAKPPRDPTMTKKTPEASDSTGLNQKAVLKAIEGEQPVKACHEKAMIPELPIEANNGGFTDKIGGTVRKKHDSQIHKRHVASRLVELT
ncbi:hypothetical protein SDJN02_03365, partial [Cucurbita argyrosperma subsp. argyrosperma]